MHEALGVSLEIPADLQLRETLNGFEADSGLPGIALRMDGHAASCGKMAFYAGSEREGLNVDELDHPQGRLYVERSIGVVRAMGVVGAHTVATHLFCLDATPRSWELSCRERSMGEHPGFESATCMRAGLSFRFDAPQAVSESSAVVLSGSTH